MADEEEEHVRVACEPVCFLIFFIGSDVGGGVRVHIICLCWIIGVQPVTSCVECLYGTDEGCHRRGRTAPPRVRLWYRSVDNPVRQTDVERCAGGGSFMFFKFQGFQGNNRECENI